MVIQSAFTQKECLVSVFKVSSWCFLPSCSQQTWQHDFWWCAWDLAPIVSTALWFHQCSPWTLPLFYNSWTCLVYLWQVETLNQQRSSICILTHECGQWMVLLWWMSSQKLLLNHQWWIWLLYDCKGRHWSPLLEPRTQLAIQSL